jgi:predicted transcriptional regulator
MAAATEQHYSIQAIADMWSLSRSAVSRLFATEPGVISLGTSRYSTLRVPESVVARVHERLSHKTLKSEFPRANPLRIIHLRDRNCRVPKKTAHILQSHSLTQAPHSERVA